MKLKDSKVIMDEVMADMGVGSGEKRSSGDNDDGQETPVAPPARSPSSLSASKRSRRNSVQMACERCRRRKIRCSGLPGPCASCARLNVACHDPGKRKDRAQSLLEDRIQRLEALALANNAFNPADAAPPFPYQINPSQSQAPAIAQPQPRQAPRVQTQNLMNISSGVDDFNQPSPLSAHSWDNWPIPGSPACYSDMGPDVTQPWPSNDYFQQSIDNAPTPNPALHRRSHTFPAIHTEDAWIMPNDDVPASASAFSDIPSIEITSHDASRPHSPQPYLDRAPSPAGISIPFRSAMIDQDDEGDDDEDVAPNMFPSFSMNTRHSEDSPVEYYGDLLSPLDQPPPIISRRSSMASSDHNTPSYDPSDRTASFVYSGTRNRIGRSQTLPTSIASEQETQQYIAMTINSPRTRDYTQVYFQVVHPEYPFLDPSTFHTNRSIAYRVSGLNSDPSQRRTTIPGVISSYQTLLVAAIGSMIRHQSRAVASRHLKHALVLQPQIDMWSSVSGLHCAILLAIYCFLESSMTLNSESDPDDEELQKPHFSEPTYTPINLWLHNCQIAAASIDLGMHVALTIDDESDVMGVSKQMALMYKNTFRSVYVLDKKISEFRSRPRALHDGDLDRDLISDLA